MDRHTKAQRRKNMQAIKGADTKIELMLRKELWKRGYRYRKNYKNLPGKPDIVFLRRRVAVFCDGEFWHGYNWPERKKDIRSNRDFWIPKIEKNMQRDIEVNKLLKELGWKVIRLWEGDIKKDIDACVKMIIKEIA